MVVKSCALVNPPTLLLISVSFMSFSNVKFRFSLSVPVNQLMPWPSSLTVYTMVYQILTMLLKLLYVNQSSSFFVSFVFQLFIHFCIFLSIDCGWCYVFTRPVMGSVCIWPGWSLGWFDYTHGVAYGCRCSEVIVFIILPCTSHNAFVILHFFSILLIYFIIKNHIMMFCNFIRLMWLNSKIDTNRC